MTERPNVDQLLAMEAASLKAVSEKYFDAPWRMPVAVATAQLGGVVRIRAVMEKLPGLDRTVGLKAMDRLVALGAIRELPRAEEAPKNEGRIFVVDADHVLWSVFAMVVDFEGSSSSGAAPGR